MHNNTDFPGVSRRCRVLCVTILSGLMLSPPAWTDSLRCGRKLIKTGDAVERVRRHCGVPQSTDSVTVKKTSLNRGKATRVQRWHYRLRSRGLTHFVLVHAGHVVAIETGARH